MPSVKTYAFFLLAVLALTGCHDSGIPPDSISPATYSLTIKVSGLVGSRLTLKNNGVATASSIGFGANGSYSDLFGVFVSGTSYDITVATQPMGPSQTCIVTNGVGTISNANVTNIMVICTTNPGRFLYGLRFSSFAVVGYAIDPTSGSLTVLNGSPFPVPMFLPDPGLPRSFVIDSSGTYTYVTTSGGQLGNFIATLAIDRTSGALTSIGSLAAGPMTSNSAMIDPFDRFLYVTSFRSLFSTYRISSSTGTLTSGDVTRMSYTAIHADPLGRFLYVMGVNDSGNPAIHVFSIDGVSGALTAISGSPFPTTSVLTIRIHPAGTWMYATSDLSSDISTYSIDASGVPTYIGNSLSGTTHRPALSAIDPTGKFLYSIIADSNLIFVYKIDPSSGMLSLVSSIPIVAGIDPASLIIDPTNTFAYVTNPSARTISVYAIDSFNGGLMLLNGSPFATPGEIDAIAISN